MAVATTAAIAPLRPPFPYRRRLLSMRPKVAEVPVANFRQRGARLRVGIRSRSAVRSGSSSLMHNLLVVDVDGLPVRVQPEEVNMAMAP